MRGKVYEGNLGEPTVSGIKSYKVKPKGKRLQRQSDEPIVAKMIGDTKTPSMRRGSTLTKFPLGGGLK